jgi:hypothetical protein
MSFEELKRNLLHEAVAWRSYGDRRCELAAR